VKVNVFATTAKEADVDPGIAVKMTNIDVSAHFDNPELIDANKGSHLQFPHSFLDAFTPEAFRSTLSLFIHDLLCSLAWLYHFAAREALKHELYCISASL
jgi:hypothetical protein